ncbi:MAG: DNA methyltransferase [Thermoanaerobaculales bacterium]
MFCHFGETLARLVRERGLTRRVLAQRLGVTVGELEEIERTAALPASAVVEHAAAALGITADELLLAAGVLPAWLEQALTDEPSRVLDLLRRELTPNVADELTASAPPSAVVPPVVFETASGRLHQGDCLALLPALPAESVDLVFADPPFNLNKDYGEEVDDDRHHLAYYVWSCTWMEQAVRVLKPGGALFLYNVPRWNLHLASWLSARLEFRHWIAIDIKFSLPIPGRLYPSHYALVYFTKGRRPARFEPPRLPIETCRHCGGEIRDYGGYKDRMNPRGVNLTDVWTDIAPVRHARFKRRRANELPLKLLDRVLDIASAEGELVLDPFGGSGTTYVAAELKRRRWIGCEIGDCQPIIERFARLDREREILGELRANLNTLFTPAVLALRRRSGHDTSKYRLDGNDSPTVHEGELFKWK